MEPTIVFKDVNLCFYSDTTVKLGGNVEITFGVKHISTYYDFAVKDIRGDAVIKGIRYIYSDGKRYDLGWNEDTKQFSCGNYKYCGFEIQHVIMPEKVDYVEVPYHLQFSSNLIKALNPGQFHEKKIVLRGYETMPFKYTVFKNREGFGKLCIKNEYDCFIQGIKDDFYYEVNENGGINMDISFIFDSSISTEKNQIPVINESRPESAELSESPKPCSEIYEIMSNKTPLKITVEQFNAETIKAALDYLYGKHETIEGKETDVFQFAKKYEIHGLIKTCCLHFIESVNPENVCEFIEIAYSNNFEELKQKCKEIIVAQKSEIDNAKLRNLPKEILLSTFCF